MTQLLVKNQTGELALVWTHCSSHPNSTRALAGEDWGTCGGKSLHALGLMDEIGEIWGEDPFDLPKIYSLGDAVGFTGAYCVAWTEPSDDDSGYDWHSRCFESRESAEAYIDDLLTSEPDDGKEIFLLHNWKFERYNASGHADAPIVIPVDCEVPKKGHQSGCPDGMDPSDYLNICTLSAEGDIIEYLGYTAPTICMAKLTLPGELLEGATRLRMERYVDYPARIRLGAWIYLALVKFDERHKADKRPTDLSDRIMDPYTSDEYVPVDLLMGLFSLSDDSAGTVRWPF